MTNAFNDISDKNNRVWNRCAMVFNLMKDHDSKVATKYLSQFNIGERDEISKMFERIKNEGYTPVRAEINRGVQANVRA